VVVLWCIHELELAGGGPVTAAYLVCLCSGVPLIIWLVRMA
jgi:hypothetical protein